MKTLLIICLFLQLSTLYLVCRDYSNALWYERNRVYEIEEHQNWLMGNGVEIPEHLQVQPHKVDYLGGVYGSLLRNATIVIPSILFQLISISIFLYLAINKSAKFRLGRKE